MGGDGKDRMERAMNGRRDVEVGLDGERGRKD